MRTVTIRTVVTAVIAAVVTSVLLYLFLPTRPAQLAPSVYERVRETGSIRAAYFVGAPLFMVDPNTGEKSGIFHDVVETAADKLGLEVDWVEEVGYGEMIQGLEYHRYDIMGSGVWLNADRGKSADFTIPAYYDAVRAYARANDIRFDGDISIANSESYTISTMDGELGAAIAVTDFPHAKRVELPQNSDFAQLILNVVNEKADLVFLAIAPAHEYMKAHPGNIRPVAVPPLRVFPVAILLPKGEYDLKQSIDYALTEMLTRGDIESILRRYEDERGLFIRTALPYLDPGND